MPASYPLRTAIPTVPLLLGAAGLLPFVGLALMRLTGLGLEPEQAGAALSAYGAVIASFLGGIRWGLAVGRPDDAQPGRDYALSVVPSLVAWFGLLMLPTRFELVLLALLIAAWGLLDQDLVRRGLAAPWFGRLRLALSAGAGLSLLAAALR
jgi:hypothetical protein